MKEIFVDVTYCPACGVPCYFPAGTFPLNGHIPPWVRCFLCGLNFNPAQGGGIEVTHRVGDARPFLTPRGILHNRRMAGL